jgi:PAS domain S-box-containing protein
MLKKTSTSSKLFLLILFFYGLVISIGILGIREIKTMRRNSDKMYDNVVYPLIQLSSVRFMYLRGIRTTVLQLKSNDITFDESLKQLHLAEATMDTQWTAYVNTVQTKEEAKLVQEAQFFMGETNLEIETLKVLIHLEDKEALKDFGLKNLNESIKETVDKLTTLIKFQEKLGNQYKNSNSNVYINSKNNLIWILVASTIIILLFGYYIFRDIRTYINALKKSNQSLLNNELKYRSVFENAGDGLFLVGTDKLIKDVNSVGVSLTGYSYEELLKMNPTELHTTEDLTSHPFKWDLLGQGKPFVRQHKLRKKDGTTIDVEMNTTLVGENEILSVVRDISERINTEKRKKTSDEKYGIAVKNSLDTIIISTFPEGVFVELNPRFSQLFGYSREESLGKKSIDLNLHLDLDTRVEIYNEISAEGFTKNREVVFRNKKGDEINCLVTSNLFHIEEEAFLYTVIKDITDQKKSEEKLVNLDRKITELIDSTNAVIWESEAETFTLTYVNPVVEKLFGYSTDEWYTDLFWKNHIYIDDRETTASHYYEQAKKSIGHTLEYRFVKSNGEVIWIRDIVNIIEEKGKPKWIRGIMIDITANKNAENELLDSNARLRLATKSGNIGVFDLDYVKKELTWDDYCYNLYGVTREQFPNPFEVIYTSLHPEDHDLAKVNGPSNSKDSTEYNAVYRIVRPDKKIRVLETSAMVIRDSAGAVLRIIGVHKDITEKKKADQELRDLTTRLQLATTSAHIGIFDLDLINTELIWDDVSFKIFGVSEKGIENPYDASTKAIHPDDLKGVLDYRLSKIQNGDDYFYTFRILWPNEEVRHIESSALILRDSTGKATRMIGVNRDITESKLAEINLIELTTRLQLATTSTNIGIYDWDLTINNLHWDETTYNMHGISSENCLNPKEALIMAIHPDQRDEALEFIVNSIKSAREFKYVYKIVLPSNEERYIESNSIILRNESTGRATRMIGVSRDITELKEAQKSLQNMNILLEEKVAIRTEDLELANKKINDSINYAQNIQLAILSKPDDCFKVFPESFMLWKPKDVVSGDFMWSHSNDKYKYIAVIDCTGHGVPGALLSIVAKQILDRIVITEGIEDPQNILINLDRAIISTLRQDNNAATDGMDIALCRIDQKNKFIVFAGAQRPLFYFNSKSIIEIPGSKLGIGGIMGINGKKSFNQIGFQYEPGQVVYLTSDGYYAQFGGKEGKKLMKSRFSDYLLDISNKPITEQGGLLNQHLVAWQGEEEQVDDVLVIGIQL